MSRDFSQQSLNDMNAVSSGEAFLFLLQMDYLNPDTQAPEVQYFVNNNVQVTAFANQYLPLAFNVVLNTQDDQKLPTVALIMDNVDRELVGEIRRLQEPPVITLTLVAASRPGVAEMVLANMVLRNVTYDAQQLSGTLFVNDILNQRFPRDRYTPTNAPGLF
jgi:hypothetical protein